jgi:hypothetical protein
VLGSHRRGRECGAEADLAVDLSAAPRMEDGDREAAVAAATAAEDIVVVMAGGDQGDLVAAGESPVVAGGSEDAAPAGPAATESASSKEEEPESKAPTKVRRGGCARNSGPPACLSNDPLLIKAVSSAEGWIRGRQRGEEDHQGIKRQGACCRCEGEEAWCPLAERLLSGPRTVRRHEGSNNAQAGEEAGGEGCHGQWIRASRWVHSLRSNV